MQLKRILFGLIFLVLVISCQSSIEVDLGSNYKLINSASFNDLTIVNNQNIVIINGHIWDYAFDSTLIIVSQCPRDSVAGIETLTKSKYQEVFEESTFRQYWIINKGKESKYYLDTLSKFARYSNVYGPYKKEEYLQRRKELKIPEELELNE